MTKILNGLFYFLKFLLFVLAVGSSLYVLFRMYQRLDKPLMGLFNVFTPYIVLFILFVINLFFRQKSVTKNVFFNLTCCLVFFTISFLALRAVMDPYMVYSLKNSYGINFNFFSDALTFIQIMLYGLCVADVFLVLSDIHLKKRNKEVNNNNYRYEEKREQKFATEIDTL